MFFTINSRNFKRILLTLTLIVSINLIGSSSYAQKDTDITAIQKTRTAIKTSTEELNHQYEQLLSKINILKSRKNLNLLEEAELMRLLAAAMNISNQLDEKYQQIEDIDAKLKKAGIESSEPKENLIKLRFVRDGIIEGPVELKERAMILKEKEERLNSEIKNLEEMERKQKLREEAQAFIKEQSLFDEDSAISVVKKSMKGVAEDSTSLSKNSTPKADKATGTESSYNDTISAGGDSSGGQSSQPSSVKVRIEVTYEKSGILNQQATDKGKSYIIDIDPGNMSPEELNKQIEELKKIYKELVDTRIEMEKKIIEIEKAFRDKKK